MQFNDGVLRVGVYSLYDLLQLVRLQFCDDAQVEKETRRG